MGNKMRVVKNIFIFFGLFLLGNMYSINFWVRSDSYIGEHQWFFIGVNFVAWVLLFALFRCLYFRQLKKANPRDFGLKINGKKELAYLFIAIFINLLIQFLLYKLNPSDSLPENQVDINKMVSQYPILMWVTIVLYGPPMEEFVFRGFFFNLFFKKDNRFNKIMAVFVSGTVFGLAHEAAFNYNWLIYASSGWILAALYEKTKSLYYPMALHIMMNFISMMG